MTAREYLINREFGCIVYNIIKCIQNNEEMRLGYNITIKNTHKNDDLLNECLDKLTRLQKIVK